MQGFIGRIASCPGQRFQVIYTPSDPPLPEGCGEGVGPMPRDYLMSWEGAPNFRWVKMRNGVRYKVTCTELKAPRTKEGSAAAANAWWRKKLVELEGDPERVEKVRRILLGEDELSCKLDELTDKAI